MPSLVEAIHAAVTRWPSCNSPVNRPAQAVTQGADPTSTGYSPLRESVLELVLLTNEPHPESVLPALSVLAHRVETVRPEAISLAKLAKADVVIVDARSDLAVARRFCTAVRAADTSIGLVVVISEGGLVALNPEWGVDEMLLPGCGPTEIEARLRLLISRRSDKANRANTMITLGELVIDEATYTARLRDAPIELTYLEFELLKYLAQHPGRVFSRLQLLDKVWGYHYAGGTRTVDVHVRRLRAKLGADHESLIGTVRNVGYTARRPPGRQTRSTH
jgi:DNA-binding response OmpR family regulator